VFLGDGAVFPPRHSQDGPDSNPCEDTDPLPIKAGGWCGPAAPDDVKYHDSLLPHRMMKYSAVPHTLAHPTGFSRRHPPIGTGSKGLWEFLARSAC
jgi:hypothetical protein